MRSRCTGTIYSMAVYIKLKPACPGVGSTKQRRGSPLPSRDDRLTAIRVLRLFQCPSVGSGDSPFLAVLRYPDSPQTPTLSLRRTTTNQPRNADSQKQKRPHDARRTGKPTKTQRIRRRQRPATLRAASTVAAPCHRPAHRHADVPAPAPRSCRCRCASAPRWCARRCG